MCFPILVKDKVPTSWLYIIWKARACNILIRHLTLFWTNVKFSIRLSAVQVTRVTPLSPWMRATLHLGPRASGRSRQGGQRGRGRTAQCRGARAPSVTAPSAQAKASSFSSSKPTGPAFQQPVPVSRIPRPKGTLAFLRYCFSIIHKVRNYLWSQNFMTFKTLRNIMFKNTSYNDFVNVS